MLGCCLVLRYKVMHMPVPIYQQQLAFKLRPTTCHRVFQQLHSWMYPYGNLGSGRNSIGFVIHIRTHVATLLRIFFVLFYVYVSKVNEFSYVPRSSVVCPYRSVLLDSTCGRVCRTVTRIKAKACLSIHNYLDSSCRLWDLKGTTSKQKRSSTWAWTGG